MNAKSSLQATAVAVLFSGLLLCDANAQFGAGFPGHNLPDNDFTWTWGKRRASGRDVEDFSVVGSDAGFRCDLTGKFRVSGRPSRMAMSEFESSLRENMRFIQNAANAMNNLDAQGDLEWAVLECVRPKRER